MAIIKFINNKVSLKKTLNYICKEEKGELMDIFQELISNDYKSLPKISDVFKQLE